MSKQKPYILGVITARGGSKGIPGKNIKMLGGKPLIAYTVESVKKSNFLSRVIVSTDDEAIARIARDFGGDVPFMRPAELALDDTPHVPVLQHALREAEQGSGTKYDYIVTLQPTSPFRTADDIDRTIAKAVEHEAHSAVSVVEVYENHPVKIKRMDGDHVLPYTLEEPEGVPRQDLPKAFKRSGAVYVTRRDILESGRLYGDTVVGHIVPVERSIDIDTPLDWIKAEWMLTVLRERIFPL